MLPDPGVGDLAAPHPQRAKVPSSSSPIRRHSRRYRLPISPRDGARRALGFLPSSSLCYCARHFSDSKACAMVRPRVEGGEAVAMRLGKSCAMAAVAALVLAVGSPADQAFAYSATGDRLFPATLVLPQIAPGDEFYVWADTLPQTPSGDGTGTRQSNFSASTPRRSPTGLASSSRRPGPGSIASPRAAGRQCRISTPRSNTWRSTISRASFC